VDFAVSPTTRLQVVEMPTYPLQLTCLGVIYGTPALAAVFVALRIYTRRKLSLRLSWGWYSRLVVLLPC
jgi:hypothetical protein